MSGTWRCHQANKDIFSLLNSVEKNVKIFYGKSRRNIHVIYLTVNCVEMYTQVLYKVLMFLENNWDSTDTSCHVFQMVINTPRSDAQNLMLWLQQKNDAQNLLRVAEM